MNEVKPVASVRDTAPGAGLASTRTARNVQPQGDAAVSPGKELPPVEQTVNTQKAVESLAAQQEKLEQAVSKLNDYVQSTQRDLQFTLDEGAGKTVITVLDRTTQEVIRQIPDQVALNLARKLNEEEPIRLFSAQA